MMKALALSLTILLISPQVFSKNKMIYGKDDRMDLYATPSEWVQSSTSTLAIIKKSNLKSIRNGNSFTLSDSIKTLKERKNLCEGERYGDQPSAAHCSAFLIGPDTILTAGHCAIDVRGNKSKREICENNYYVFDYYIQNADAPFEMEFSKDNVFNCKQVIDAVYENRGLDYAIIKLDRKVRDRKPLNLNYDEVIELDEPLTIIGNPWGLPIKLAGGAKVVRNEIESSYFAATLDSFSGNSGSAVFNSDTQEVQGILVRGKTDSLSASDRYGKSCNKLNYCDDDGLNCLVKNSMKAEEVIKISSIALQIKKALELK